MGNLPPNFILGLWARPIMVYRISYITRLRLYLTSLIILCLSLFLSSCGTSSLVFYEHGPSVEFYKNYDINNPSLQPFKDSGIFFTVTSTPRTNFSEYVVWLGLSSEQENRSVKIDKAIIQGTDWEQISTLQQEFFIEKTYDQEDLLQGIASKSYFDHEKLFILDIDLFLIEKEMLEQIYQDESSLNVQIFYQIDGKKGVMNYQLKRRVETYLNYPT